MIFFLDKNNPSYQGYQLFRETSEPYREASDEERLSYMEWFLDEYYKRFNETPTVQLAETLNTFMLKPYIGDKTMEYKILSTYSLERREQKQVNYVDELRY